MSKVNVKKHSTFIDMTAMSDVTVLLLTFFMLTANFIPREPVQVITPGSVSEIKIPEANIMTILIDLNGRIFLFLDKREDKVALLENIGKDYNITFTNKQKLSFVNQPSIGMPISLLPKFLDMDSEDQDAALRQIGGIPADSTNNQFREWVRNANAVNKELAIAVKADGMTPYPKVNRVLTTLRELKLNRYNLVTTLKGTSEGF